MITLKGAEVSAKIKEQVLAMNGKLGGYVPTSSGSASGRMISPTREMS